jgi:hypothetical protein
MRKQTIILTIVFAIFLAAALYAAWLGMLAGSPFRSNGPWGTGRPDIIATGRQTGRTDLLE